MRAAQLAGGGAVEIGRRAVLDNGAFCFGAWLLIAAACAAWPGEARIASARRLGGAFAVVALGAIPDRQTCLLALAAGALLLGRNGHDGARRIAWLLGALGLAMAWTSSYAMALHDAAALLDARLVGAVLSAAGLPVSVSGNVVVNLPQASEVAILGLCASTFPLALVCLAFVVVRIYLGFLPARRDLPWLAASVLASVALSELRLCLMVLHTDHFGWWHDGGGKTLYELAALLPATLFPVLASRAAPEPACAA